MGSYLRKHHRNKVKSDVTVNQGIPYSGGKLHDMSVGGAAVIYPDKTYSHSTPLTVGQVLVLNFEGAGEMPARVIRTFDGGFAAKFDFSVSLRKPVHG